MEKTRAAISHQIDLFYAELDKLDVKHGLTIKAIENIRVDANYKKHHDIVSMCFKDIKVLPLNIRKAIANLFGLMFPPPIGLPVPLMHECDEVGGQEPRAVL